MLCSRLVLAFCGVVISLVVNLAPACAQERPAVVVQNPSESSFDQFCEAFGLRDYTFAVPGTLWGDSVYQEARSFILDAAFSKSAIGRRAGAYVSKADTLQGDIAMLEMDGRDRLGLSSLDPVEGSLCPAGTSLFQQCPIGSCDYVTGVTCVNRDASSLAERKDQLLDQLVKNLERGVSTAATTAKRKRRAKEIKSALTGLKDEHREVRKKFGWAVFCK
jgi:hypothetical protein